MIRNSLVLSLLVVLNLMFLFSRPKWGGNLRQPSKRFLPFEEARSYVQNLGFRTVTEFGTWASSTERPRFIPSNPQKVYINAGWTGFRNYLDIQPTPDLKPLKPIGVVKRGRSA